VPSRTPDLASIVAGLVLLALGGVLLLDATGVVALTFEALAPIACAAVGAVLVAVGLTRDE
jgi:hypothetical protein